MDDFGRICAGPDRFWGLATWKEERHFAGPAEWRVQLQARVAPAIFCLEVVPVWRVAYSGDRFVAYTGRREEFA